MAFSISKLFGDENKRALARFLPLVKKINDFEEKTSKLSNEEIVSKTREFRTGLAKKNFIIDDILPEAFALVREAAKRTLKQRHFDVQLLGGIAMHYGNIAEMKTGEGKTLVATLPVYLNALEAKGVHIVTVNDYLASRDAVWMGQIYNALGLSVGVITHDTSCVYDENWQNKNNLKDEDSERDVKGSFHVVHEFLRPVSRQDAYQADITYGTNSEFGFDYLRDNITYEAKDLRQREPHYAIVDEIDSILIDEARTPLIISAPTRESESLYNIFSKVASNLNEEKHYRVDEKHKSVLLNDDGIQEAERMLGVGNIYTEHGVKYVHHLETAVKAKALFKKDKEYVVRDNEIIIVDEFTGRMQPGRRWSEGLHQAIEAKEGVKIQQESRTFASITYQNYFRLFKKLAGMTGTAKTSAEEFFKVYHLNVISIPTNKPLTRIDKNDLIFQTEQGKWKAIARKVKEINMKGQPVLIGTVSIEKNELLSAYLKKEGVNHEILNAKNHEREAEIVAQAGRFGGVTIATNMAGRGVDIKLGGNPPSLEIYSKVKGVGGLFVLGTERHEARRIDNQLRGRSGRQGDPGETQFFVSLEDSLMRVFASEMIKKMMGRFGIPEDEPIDNSLITRSLETAQSRIEGFNFDARKHILEFDDVMNLHRKTVYERRRKILTGSNNDVVQELYDIVDENDKEFVESLKKKESELGREQFAESLRKIFLQTIDIFWMEHLEVMDHLRSSVSLRAYGQRDPLVEYKKEGTQLFKKLMISVDSQVLSVVPNMAGKMTGEGDETEAKARVLSANPSIQIIKETHGRNDKVMIIKDNEEKEIKYKKLEEYEKDGWKIKP